MQISTSSKTLVTKTSLLFLLLLCSFSFAVFGQNGAVYSYHGLERDYRDIYKNDKFPAFIIVGDFTTYGGKPLKGVAVLGNSAVDEQPVSDFNPGTGLNGAGYAAIEYKQGFLIAGDFTAYNDTLANRLVVVKANGSIDKSFNAGSGANGAIRDVVIPPGSSKVILVGEFTTYNGKPAKGIARINADGSLDETFNSGEGANGSIFTIEYISGEKLYIGGDFTSYNGTNINRIARINFDGSLDGTFDPAGGANGPVYVIKSGGDGLFVGGDFTTFNGESRNRFANINNLGALSDKYAGTGFQSAVRAITNGYYTTYVGGHFGFATIEEGGFVGSAGGLGVEYDAVYQLTPFGYSGARGAGKQHGSAFFGVMESGFSIELDQVSPSVVKPGDKVKVWISYGGPAGPNNYFEVKVNGAIVAFKKIADLPESYEIEFVAPLENGFYNVTVDAVESASGSPGTGWPVASQRNIDRGEDNLQVAPTEWTGSRSTAFGDAGNWSLGLPNENTDVIIKSATRYPVLNSGTFNARNFLINQGASFTLATGGTLNVRKNFSNNGVYVDENGVLTVGTIGGSSLTQFNNFTVSSTGAELAGPVAIAGVLTLKGDLKTNNQTLMLLSNENGTAYVNNAGGEVEGTASMERQIDDKFNVGPGYRHFSSPVKNTTVSSLAADGYAPMVNPAYNTAPNPYTVKPFPTIFGYDESRLSSTNATTSAFDFGWSSPASLSSALEPGKGYSVNIPATAKVTLSGELNSGTISVSGLGNQQVGSASGWHLLGNPYPSPIDWTKIILPSGIGNAVYVYRSSGRYIGSYATYVNGVGDADARYIAPMQGFFVRATANNQTFTFSNDARVYNVKTNLYRTGGDLRPQLQLNLKNSSDLADELYVYFEENVPATVDGKYDAFKVLTYNFDRPTLFARLGKEPLSIKGLPLNNAVQTLPLELYVPANGTYTFSVAKMVNFSSNAQVQLIDLEKSQTYDLSNGKEVSVQLTTTTTPGRYVLRFTAVKGGPLSAGEELESEQLQVYPNPATGDVNLLYSNVKASSEPVQVVIFNSLGQQVLTRTLKGAEVQAGVKLATAGFAPGVYHVKVSSQGKIHTKKLVLQ
ncbi:T9SS type A sorting domain-containing protein [Rufibacter psychrotolerans]|uniref:T9SS type A sorting domain-containing protein n=1 Tax=Rufibacter psychrotolerans TaxID=2812556 RepID=UPI0019686696|nr:T9SS type A sorting domain-containing protein [Rufibacter sp. SYSU D00308]